MKGDLGRSWDRLLSNMFIIHKGYRAEKNNGQWWWREKPFDTIDDFKDYIDEYIQVAGEYLGNSINRLK